MSHGRHRKPSNAGRYAKAAAFTATGSFAGLTLLVTSAGPVWADEVPSPAPGTIEEQPVTPAPPAPPASPLTDDGTFGQGCEVPGTPERCDPAITPDETPTEEVAVVVPGDTLSGLAPILGAPTWQELAAQNIDVVGDNPHLIFPGEEIRFLAGATPPVPPAASRSHRVDPPPVEIIDPPAAPEVVVPDPAPPAAVAGSAPISNSNGPVSSRAQAGADAVFANVPGAQLISIGGTRASAIDKNGHPSGNALDYMVLSDSRLGDAIVSYHVANWDSLGVEYIIWEQRILTSPTGLWKPMADRGGNTANHYDHVHVNYDR